MIEGVQIKKLQYVPDDRGRLMEILRRDDPMFEKFGQVYITTCLPGVVKAWHAHRFQNDNLAVVSGTARIVLADLRPKSPTLNEINEFYSGDYSPLLVHIPAGVYHGFACTGTEEAILLNVPTACYNRREPDELRLPPETSKIKFTWTRRDR